ncbi:hypothetical protein TBLA_0B09080 [Henningerozyma blattae CBS 6284]|uniref:Uncharacterized protein n=1 Tax=Henningerozyma blattae (strain ATCC 34711 / CBS 6284 / DSM 70876 / NBRC 10599 / NRRL Y-10934 / UCD 77-7) TaxID=1071380 RepID=I2H021_HENB6|nr:hypothetical protein TBLA_0B09080 [Tetrapisispora blattae CBS 6284]CCH59723.1 hypothetical protein TBLA_0B09080 [Tetrapisispora blattae CBS 6284]
MCGRFALEYSTEELFEQLNTMHIPTQERDSENVSNDTTNISTENNSTSPQITNKSNMQSFANGYTFQPSYNVSPTNMSAVYHHKTVKYMKWGLIPYWSKDPSNFKSYSTFNARVESLLESKMWSQCCKKKRCVIPISGYYEWKTANKTKTPFYITNTGKNLLFLAGMYDYIEDLHLYTFTIVTSKAPKELAWLHERMPVILEPNTEEWNTWLDKKKITWSKGELTECLTARFNENLLECYQVSKDVGKTTNNGSYLIKPILKQDISKFILKQEKKVGKGYNGIKKEMKQEDNNDIPYGYKANNPNIEASCQVPTKQNIKKEVSNGEFEPKYDKKTKKRSILDMLAAQPRKVAKKGN